MAGHYLKNDDVFKSFTDWLDDALKLNGKSHPLTAHVSSFGKLELSRQQTLEHSLNLFLELVNKSVEKKCVDDLMPMLVIPLGCSDNLCFWDDSLSLSNQLSDEPPSIYLYEREKIKYLEVTEEYKTPINLELPKIEAIELNIYYRCFRDSVAIQNDWEFNKAVYLECYTCQYLY